MASFILNPMKRFNNGDKVRDCYGRVLTVVCQIGSMVEVYELCGEWFHPTKLFRVRA